MIRPVGPLHNSWVLKYRIKLDRCGPQLKSLTGPLDAMMQRQLGTIDQELAADDLYTLAILYRYRPRPPS